MSSGPCHAETTTTATSLQRGIVAHRAEDVDPADAGKHHVEKDKIGRLFLDPGECGLAVDCLLATKVVAERDDDQLTQRRLVVDDQNTRA